MLLHNHYNAIDITKLFMAFLVIGIHVGATFEKVYPQFLNFILGTAVPFFFICSGFFMQSKLSKTGNNLHVLKTSAKRFLKLYILWHIVYFPIALKYLWTNGRDFMGDFQYCLHMFFFVGEIIYSWPLWYLHGLIVAILLIYLLERCRLSLCFIWIISIIMMLIGNYIHYVTTSGLHFYNTILNICQYSVDLLGTAERNGPFRGFALVTTGMMIRQYHQYIKYEFLIGAVCIIFSWCLFTYLLPLHLLFSGGGLFIITASIKLKDKPIYSTLRIHSTLIYFIHMYFVVAAHMLFQEYIINTTYVYMIWIIIFLVTWLVSYLFNYLRKIPSFIWLNNLIS